MPSTTRHKPPGKAANYGFSAAWIQHVLATAPENLRLMIIKGDGMKPTLLNEDAALVDIGSTVLSPPGIFAIFDGTQIVAKRLELVNAKSPRVRVMADNSLYGSYESPVTELRVLGRIVWFGRKI